MLITKRGVPFVKLNPIDNSKSEIWKLREKFINENGKIETDIPVIKRETENFNNIFEE